MAVDLIARAMASRSGGGGSGGAVSSVNGQTGNVVLSYADVDALPNTTTIPTKTSQLSNDSNFITDPNYIPYTPEDKNKVNNIPTKVSQLQNDELFITNEANDLKNYYNKTEVNSSLTNKADKTSIPTKTSQLTNDSNFITNTVNNLVNYYNTLSTYSKSEVNGLINTISSLSLQKVNILPTENISKTTIYLLLKTGSIYEQYINLTGVSDGYEMIGTTEINLNNYYDKLESDILLDKKVNISDLQVINEKIGNDTLEIGSNLSNAVNELLNLIKPKPLIKRYGIKINLNDSNPDTRVEYLYEAVGMKPAFMNFTTGMFDYGDWGDIWFVKNNRPVMLKFDGTVDYELNHSDLTKKIDGTQSDAMNLNYQGNAMSEIPLIWVKRYTQDGYDYIIFCENQYDNTYKAYAHTNIEQKTVSHMYLSIYEGVVASSRIRSISGQACASGYTANVESSYCESNGKYWNKLSFSDCNLMYEMGTMISKSTNSQEKFGKGYSDPSSFNYLRTGTLNNKGQFYGYNTITFGIKLFYCENFFGNLNKRITGFLNYKTEVLLKLTPPYNNLGNDYIKTGIVIPGQVNEGYCNKMIMTDGGRVPFSPNGSETTFECDGFRFAHTGQESLLAVFGGAASSGAKCGLSCWETYFTEYNLNASMGTSVSCKPPVIE